MATYTLEEAPEIVISVRGKDSADTRNRALEKVNKMVDSGELDAEVVNDLSAEQFVLTEAQTKTNNADGDPEQDPLETAVRELQRCLLLKLKTQQLKKSADQARQNITTALSEESAEQDLEQMEETLKGNFKTLKEYIGSLKEFRQAKSGAIEALTIIDKALQIDLSISVNDESQPRQSNDSKLIANH